ncbi:MAG: acyltransferase [Deltaproteobacteria bacterium]|nr:acyltransferase [Deltaproteobacteria bacterium]
MNARRSEEKFSRGVEALKGLAILGIVFYHYFRRETGVENQFQWYFGRLPSHPQEWGYLGTSLFFILSGWALTQSSGDSVVEPWGFYSRRLRRILPLYHLSLLVFFFGFLFLTTQNLGHLVAEFSLKAVFLQNFSAETIFSYNSSWWFLGTLVYLYAVYPWLHRRFLKQPDIALVFCLFLGFFLSHFLALPKVAGWNPFLAMGGFPFVKLGEFGFGIWVARVGTRSERKWLVVTAALFALGLLGLKLPSFYPWHPIGLMAPLFLVAAWIPPFGLERLGAYSYGLFLFHRPLIDPWLRWLRLWGVPESAWLAPLAFTILLLLFTVPLEMMVNHVFRRRQQRGES